MNKWTTILFLAVLYLSNYCFVKGDTEREMRAEEKIMRELKEMSLSESKEKNLQAYVKNNDKTFDSLGKLLERYMTIQAIPSLENAEDLKNKTLELQLIIFSFIRGLDYKYSRIKIYQDFFAPSAFFNCIFHLDIHYQDIRFKNKNERYYFYEAILFQTIEYKGQERKMKGLSLFEPIDVEKIVLLLRETDKELFYSRTARSLYAKISYRDLLKNALIDSSFFELRNLSEIMTSYSHRINEVDWLKAVDRKCVEMLSKESK